MSRETESPSGGPVAAPTRASSRVSPHRQRVAVPGVVFYRIADGKIAEFRGQFDRMSLMEQLGAVPNSNTPAP